MQVLVRNSGLLSFVPALTLTAMAGAESRRAAFKAWIAANDLTAAQVADRAKVPRTTLYSYLDGKAQSMKGTTQEAIASAFGVGVDTLFTFSSDLAREIGVWGKIGARADVFPLSDYTSDPMYEVALPPGLSPDEEYVAFEIEGFSMPPAEPGWIVVFRMVERATEDLINSPCLVDTADGRRLFKIIRRGYTAGHYNLESWDGSPLIEDVEITAALPFAAITPGRKAR